MNQGDLSEGERLEIDALRRRADRNAHGHISHALRLRFLDDLATLISALGGAVIMAASALLLGTDSPNRVAEIVVATMASVVTLVSVWQAIWQPAARAKRHQSWGTRFVAIENECRLSLCGSGRATVVQLMDKMVEISDQLDLVPEHRWKRLRN